MNYYTFLNNNTSGGKFCKYCNIKMPVTADENNKSHVFICEKCGHIEHVDNSFKRLCTCKNCRNIIQDSSKKDDIRKFDLNTKLDLISLIENNGLNSVDMFVIPANLNHSAENNLKCAIKNLLSKGCIEVDYDREFNYQIENTRYNILDFFDSIFRFNVNFAIDDIEDINKTGFYKKIFNREEAMHFFILLCVDTILKETSSLYKEINIDIDITDFPRKELFDLFKSFSYVEILSRFSYSRYFNSFLIKAGQPESYLARKVIKNSISYIKNNPEKAFESACDLSSMFPILDKFDLPQSILYSVININNFVDYEEIFEDEFYYEDI